MITPLPRGRNLHFYFTLFTITALTQTFTQHDHFTERDSHAHRKELPPLRRIQEDGADATVEPKPGQKALHIPSVGCSVVDFHFYTIVPLHSFPVAPSDKQLSAQGYQAAVLVERVNLLDLKATQKLSHGKKYPFFCQ